MREPSSKPEALTGYLIAERELGDLNTVSHARVIAPGLSDARTVQPIGTTSSYRAVYWRLTVAGLRTRLVASGKLDDRLIDTFLVRCADPAWWTQTIAFTAAAGHVRGE